MRGEQRTAVLKQTKELRKRMKQASTITISLFSRWDIHRKGYSVEEYSARLIRFRKEFDVDIYINARQSRHPSYCKGFVVFHRCGVALIKRIDKPRLKWIELFKRFVFVRE